MEFLDEEHYDNDDVKVAFTFHSRWFKPELMADGEGRRRREWWVIRWRES